MEIVYREIKQFSQSQLAELFCSVGWESGKYPEKLSAALANYPAVFSAWDGDKLVGLISAMDDGAMNAYVHYLLVSPGYQHCGIGTALVGRIKETYRNYFRIILIAVNEHIPFYEARGFRRDREASPMYLLS